MAGLEELFSALKADVEALFMQAPTVHLEALAAQLHAMEPHLEELVTLQATWHTGTETLQLLPLCLRIRCGNAPLQWLPTRRS